MRCGAAVLGDEPGAVGVLGGGAAGPALRIGTVRILDAGDAAAAGDLAAEQVPGVVDEMCAVGADPAASGVAFVDPPVRAAPQPGAEERPAQMPWCADHPGVGQLLELGAGGLMPQFKKLADSGVIGTPRHLS